MVRFSAESPGLQIPGLAPGSYGIGWSGGAVGEAEWTTVPAGGEARLAADSTERQRRGWRELVDGAHEAWTARGQFLALLRQPLPIDRGERH